MKKENSNGFGLFSWANLVLSSMPMPSVTSSIIITRFFSRPL